MKAKNSIKLLTVLGISLLGVCSTGIAIAQTQGTITTVFHNDCIGNRDMGINASIRMDDMVMGAEYNLNVPERYNDPMKILWLKCGEKVTKVLKYDIPFQDYKLGMLLVRGIYTDNWRSQKDVFTMKTYHWPADGSTCNITYGSV